MVVKWSIVDTAVRGSFGKKIVQIIAVFVTDSWSLWLLDAFLIEEFKCQ